MIDRLCAILLP